MSDQTGRDPDILTTEELAARIGLHPQTVRRMAKAGTIPGLRTGKDWRFLYSAVLEELRRPHPTGDRDDEDHSDTD